MFRHRQFWIILAITAIVWLCVTMSEHNDYPLQVRVEWVGYDTSRFAVISADTLLPLTVRSNGFNAIARSREVRRRPFSIAISGDTSVTVNEAFFDEIADAFGFVGVESVKSSRDRLSIAISERQRVGFVPQLRNVDFAFAEQCGLSGAPVIEPDTVWLYGSPAELVKIHSVATAPATLKNICDSCCRTLALDPVWRQFPQLRSSADSIRIFLPVERYIEKSFTLPVRLNGLASSANVKIYPERADVTLWVPSNAYDLITSDMIRLVADYNPDAPSDALPLRVASFPANTRIKSLVPSSIQYVIIR